MQNTGRTRFKKGQIPWNKGKQCSDETKRKISESKKGVPSGRMGEKTGRPAWNSGTKGLCKPNSGTFQKGNAAHTTPHTEETKAKTRRPHPAQRGENHPNWKGGKSKSYRHQTSRYEYKAYRKAVFERDNYTCQHCGQHGGYLIAHHIKGWTAFPDLRFEVSNGLALCEDCHSKTDNYKHLAKTKKV